MRFSALKLSLRNTFIAGLVITLPIGVTILILQAMFIWLDGLFAPVARRFTATPIPGLGIVSTVLIVFAIGLFATNILGRTFVSFGESIVARIPLFRTVYYGTKQVLQSMTAKERQAFKQVVMVEYPQRGSYTLGFITGETTGEIQKKFPEPLMNVFISTAPNPTTGFLLIVPKKDLIVTAISVEDAIKMVMSGGILSPPDLPMAQSHA